MLFFVHGLLDDSEILCLRGSNPGVWVAKSPPPRGKRASRFKWCPQRDVRVRLAPPAFAASLRSLRAALENACAFPQLRTLPGSNPGVGEEKKPVTARVTGFAFQMVPPAGFEPAISTLKGWRPWPLDDGDSGKEYSRLFCRRVYRWQTGKPPHRSGLLSRFSNISICNIWAGKLALSVTDRDKR